jgi:protocatechuate 3,4-dioxygenase alpha subunit
MGAPPLTPSQTIGPFFHEGLEWVLSRRGGDLQEGEWLVVGSVLDANGNGVPDAMLEVFALRPDGFQRVFTDAAGRFTFVVRPDVAGGMAYVTIFARGLQRALHTRLYSAGTIETLRARPEVAVVPPERLDTLRPSAANPTERTLEWSVRLQGDQETIFFELVCQR